jgi:hypothetical protein
VTARSKKTYAVLIALALLALLVDRLLPGSSELGPEPAQAAAHHARQAATANALVPVSMVVAAPFPRELAPAPEAVAVRDIFALTPRLYAVLVGMDPPEEGAARGILRRPARPRIAEFKAAHRLSAVLSAPALRIAMVDGRWIREGEQLDGCTLARIAGQTAYFSCADGTADISVARLIH